MFIATCVGVPWQFRPDQRNLARPVVLVAEADQGVAPVTVMPAVPKTDRRRHVTKRDLVKSDAQRAEARSGKAKTRKNNIGVKRRNNISMRMLRYLPTRHGE